MNYYNENNKYCAQWLRNMIEGGLIPKGEVDDRSIKDVRPSDLDGFTQCHFFAGIAGWSFALNLAGWPADREVWTGSCPCQPFSQAGKRRGFDDERHLWPIFYELIKERKPSVVFGEQVSSKDGVAWFDGVSDDMEEIDYACPSFDLPAACIDIDQVRQRLFWVADRDFGGERGRPGQKRNPTAEKQSQVEIDDGERVRLLSGRTGEAHRLANAKSPEREWIRTVESGQQNRLTDNREFIECGDGKLRRIKPGIRLLVDGFPGRRAQIRAFGNAIVPPVAAEFIKAYLEVIDAT